MKVDAGVELEFLKEGIKIKIHIWWVRFKLIFSQLQNKSLITKL